MDPDSGDVLRTGIETQGAPPLAKVIAGTSLFLWVGVVYFGRHIPWGL